jgi:hypothetical protein
LTRCKLWLTGGVIEGIAGVIHIADVSPRVIFSINRFIFVGLPLHSP